MQLFAIIADYNPNKLNIMKKVILSMAVALACVTGANAQKQAGGEKNLEVQFAPLSESPVSISGIRLRIFNSESSAIRLGVNLGGSKSEEITQFTISSLFIVVVHVFPESFDV